MRYLLTPVGMTIIKQVTNFVKDMEKRDLSYIMENVN
jgi:hypothetical protein